jgi:hypothetical protein
VRVAHALERLPLIRDAFMMGRLSYSKVRAIVRIANPELETTLLDIAEHATGAQIDKLVAGFCRAGRLMNPAQDHDEYIRWDYDEDGCVLIRGRLSPTVGAKTIKALESARAALKGNQPCGRA